MWVIRILSGPQAGEILSLKPGTNIIGRAPHCDIKIVSSQVSKEHAKLDVLDGKVVVSDLGSRNGTFVNGTQVKSMRLNAGDKIALHDVLVEVMPLAPQQVAYLHQARQQHQMNQSQQAFHGNAAARMHPQSSPDPQQDAGPFALNTDNDPQFNLKRQKELILFVKTYIENVLLPGIYRVAEMFEFRWVLAAFIVGFVVLVTSMSSIPLVRILKASIEKESQRRALTIARTLARINRPALMQGMESALSLDVATREPGVQKAFIISNVDGNIIAPSQQVGSYPNIPFVHEARRLGREDVQQIDSSTIGAIVPIEFYNSETGSQAVTAHAVIIYDMGALAIDDGRTLSLFIQTLFIALLMGAVLFFFLYKIIERPITALNEQLNLALKEGRDDLSTPFQFPALQSMVSNINSALNRAMSGGSNQAVQPMERDRNLEMMHVVELMGFPAMAISFPDRMIRAINPAFEEKTGLNSMQILNVSVDKTSDQALKLSMQDLISRVEAQPEQIASNNLEFGGIDCQLVVKAIFGSQNIAYFLFVIVPGDGGGA